MAAETVFSAERARMDTELFSGKGPRVPSLGVPYPALNAREPTNRLLTTTDPRPAPADTGTGRGTLSCAVRNVI